MNILAIETSCDETACAVVQDGTKIISNVVASSKTMHEKYGGVVPEIAAREQLKCIIPVLTEALAPLANDKQYNNTTIQQYIDAIAVTVGPGLIGSLLVGVETAKTIAFVTGKPIIPVNHVIAHMYANFVNHQQSSIPHTTYPIPFPVISLVASGAHTELYLMKSVKELTWLGGTVDDAAGECFDKCARLIGFGHGGGLAIQKAAQKIQISNFKFQIKFPRPMMNDETYNFSFSGLKTAVLREWGKRAYTSDVKDVHTSEVVQHAFAYEIQEAITDVLVEKTIRAANQYGAKSILLSGGVASNTRLREKFFTKLRSNEVTKLSLHAPPVQLCTDNAVMIAAAAYFRGQPEDWHTVSAVPDLTVET